MRNQRSKKFDHTVLDYSNDVARVSINTVVTSRFEADQVRDPSFKSERSVMILYSFEV